MRLINLGSSITLLGTAAFANSGLVQITLPASVAVIGTAAFQGCTNLSSVDMSQTSIIAIPPSAFSGCTSLSSIATPLTVLRIGSSAFAGCTSIGPNIPLALLNSVQFFGDAVFDQCTGLTAVTFSANVVQIGAHVLRGCRQLLSVSVAPTTQVTPDSFPTCVGYGVGTGGEAPSQAPCLACESGGFATALDFPAGVVSIIDGAFAECTDLQQVRF